MKNDSEKFCVKCIHYSETFDPYNNYHNHIGKLCLRPTKKTDLVTGKQERRFVECYAERSRIGAFFGGCGPSGKFFIKRPVVKLNPPGEE